MRWGRFWSGWLLLVVSLTLVQAWRWRGPVHPDWLIARSAGDDLLSARGLLVYADNPRAQMGPLALVLAQMPRMAYLVLVAVAVGVFLGLVALAADLPTRAGARAAAAVGGGLLVAPWTQLAWKGHADDALVLLGAAWLLLALARRRRVQAVAALALAMLGKPTALVLTPLMLVEAQLAIAGALAVLAVWGPFLAADASAMLSAGRGVMPVGAGSLPDVVGHRTGEPIPAWVRGTQLVGGLGATLLGVLRQRPAEGLLLAFTVRAAVETNPAPAYSIPLVALAILPDIRRGYPLLAPLAALTFWLSQPVLDGGPGWPRLVALAALTAATLACMQSNTKRPWRGSKLLLPV